MRIILLGPPGAGKGTQSKTLAARLTLPHISTGDLLRQNVANATVLGKEAKGYMEQGALVPDALVNKMLAERFTQKDVRSGFILDGYPRTLMQAEALDELLTTLKLSIDIVMYLDTSEPVIVQRLTGRRVCKNCGANFHVTNMPPKKDMVCDHCQGPLYQRTDDNEATIRNRLAVYEKEVASLIAFYKKQNKLIRIAADDEAEVVMQRMIASLKHDSLKV
ncbi:MAG: adenylate kinase [Candidatus Omnitrophica bacterium]|nr:adenylate kinase [Candidatus Omnitrophota bacterium]